jgi:tetratricopeptide (TPR) repeat protein
VWPWQLATSYYWVHPTLTFHDVVLPFVIDLMVAALIVYVGLTIQKKGTRAQSRTFWFFAAWSILSLLPYLQVAPLDMTASEPWLYLPMAGVLGMVGLAGATLVPSMRFPAIRMDRRVPIAIGATLLVILGARTALRGNDYSSSYTLAQQDIASSPEDFNADIVIAVHLTQQGNLAGATEYARNAVSVFPDGNTYNALGVVLFRSGDYAQAKTAFMMALTFGQDYWLYENLGELTIWYGDLNSNRAFLISSLGMFPQDGKLWLYLAVLDQRNHDNVDAKVAISNAYANGTENQYVLTQIMNNAPIGALTP